MSQACKSYREQIPRMLFGDLGEGEARDLHAHLCDCSDCAREQEDLEATLETLRAAGNPPLPRHFFVYPSQRDRSIPRWKASPFWHGALAACLLAGVLAALVFGPVHVRAEGGVFMLSIGSAPDEMLVDAWSGRLTGAVEKRYLEENRQLASRLRHELDGLRNETALLVSSALGELDRGLDRRIALRTDALQSDMGLAMIELYRAVSDQRRDDLSQLGRRLEQFADHNRIQDERTEAMLAALFPVDGPSGP